MLLMRAACLLMQDAAKITAAVQRVRPVDWVNMSRE